MAHASKLMAKDRAASLGRETVAILEAGKYRAPSGREVVLEKMVAEARARTVSYPPDATIPPVSAGKASLNIEVVNRTTLAVAEEMTRRGLAPGVLNFASATEPGGGFLTGARAQEEGLARSSGLYTCLQGSPMYAFHRGAGHRGHFYTCYALYSADVPVFRNNGGTLLEEPWLCSMLTCAAVQANRIREKKPGSEIEIADAMRERVHRVLHIFASHGHRHLLLGAWGCGAFGNDGNVISTLFRDALHGDFRGVFETVVFAITDWSDERRFIGPFERAFAAPPAG